MSSFSPTSRRQSSPAEFPALLAWGAWLLYAAGLFAQVALYGVNLPKYDEWWDIIPVFDGQRPLDFAYLWTPNFGHRLLLSRLVQIGLLRATHGDFRAGMFFNALCLVLAALVLLLALRRSRPDRRTRLGDVAVPLLLLSWTHFDNVLWEYQAQYVLSVLFVCCLLGVVLVRGGSMDLPAAAAAGAALLLLPICGFNGLVFVPPAAVWLAYLGARRGRAGAALAAIGGATLLFSLVCLANPGQGSVSQFDPAAAVQTVLGFLSLGFGVAGMPSGEGASRFARFSDLLPLLTVSGVLVSRYAPRRARPATATAYLLFALSAATWLSRPLHAAAPLVLPAAVLCLYAAALSALARAWRAGGPERGRAEGLFALLLSSLLLTAAIGLGRATGGMAPRYATLAVMPMVGLYSVLATYDGGAGRGGVRTALLTLIALVIVLAPVNFNRVRANLPASARRQRELLRAIRSGVPITRLAAQPYDFRSLGPGVVLQALPRLKAAGIRPYTALADDPPPRDLAEIAPASSVCDGVERRGDGTFTATRAGGTVTLRLPRPYEGPLVHLRYAYLGVRRGDPYARLVLRTPGGTSVVPTNAELAYNDWVPTQDAEALCTTDVTVAALVVTLPAPGTTLKLGQVTVWR